MMKSIVLGVILASVALGQGKNDFHASQASPTYTSNHVGQLPGSVRHDESEDHKFTRKSNYEPDESGYSTGMQTDSHSDQGYQDDQFSHYPSVKDSYGGGGGGGGYSNGGGGGGYGGGGNHGNGGGYQDQNNYGGGGGGGYPDHNEGYSSSRPLGGPFKGLLRAGSLLLPILLILGLGLFFPAVVNIPGGRRRRSAKEYPFESKPSSYLDTESLTFAAKMLLKASKEESCLKFIACKLGEKSKAFPLKARLIK